MGNECFKQANNLPKAIMEKFAVGPNKWVLLFWSGLKTEMFWFWTLCCEAWKGSLNINCALDPNPDRTSEEA